MLEDIQDSTYQIGYGMTISHDNTLIRVGSRRFIATAGITIPDHIRDMMDDPHHNGNTLILVTVDQQVGGAIELQPQIRPGMKQIIQRLRQQGISHCAIISGDHRQPTQTLAEELGMDEYFYDVLPEDKARLVEQLKQQNRSVCFVGDGINDALAMQLAHVSISLAGATTMATDVADIIFMDGTLQHLDELSEISHKWEIVNVRNTTTGWLKRKVHVASVWVWDGEEPSARRRHVLFMFVSLDKSPPSKKARRERIRQRLKTIRHLPKIFSSYSKVSNWSKYSWDKRHLDVLKSDRFQHGLDTIRGYMGKVRRFVSNTKCIGKTRASLSICT